MEHKSNFSFRLIFLPSTWCFSMRIGTASRLRLPDAATGSMAQCSSFGFNVRFGFRRFVVHRIASNRNRVQIFEGHLLGVRQTIENFGISEERKLELSGSHRFTAILVELRRVAGIQIAIDRRRVFSDFRSGSGAANCNRDPTFRGQEVEFASKTIGRFCAVAAVYPLTKAEPTYRSTIALLVSASFIAAVSDLPLVRIRLRTLRAALLSTCRCKFGGVGA